MIEKIMKAVKSGSKKRGRNITIGAVVGFLLSCTVAIGADEYLWIKNNGGIKFSTNNSTAPTSLDNPYSENSWDGSIYINNIILSGTDNGSGTDAYGLKLEGDLGAFKLINNGSITGTSTSTKSKEKGCGIYNVLGANIGSIINNGSITGSATGDGKYGIGIYNESETIASLVNNGLITGTFAKSDGESYGIYNYSGRIESLINNGLITGTDMRIGGKGHGIYNYSGRIESLANNGSITGIATAYGKSSMGIINTSSGRIESLANNGSTTGVSTGDNSTGIGIYNNTSSTIGNLTNNGSITGTSTGSGGEGYGIWNQTMTTIESLANNGLIIGTSTGSGGKGYGISNDSGTISALTNTGVIYGKTNAVENSNGGTITGFNNYGLLISEDGAEDTVKDATLANEGLIFKVAGGIYTAKDDDYKKFGTTAIADGYTIINAKAKNNDKTDIGGTESLSLDNGILTDGKSKEINISSDGKYVLNGITDTLKVTGQHNNLNNSIINAYETAVIMNESESILTLNNTVVNGGISEGNTVKIAGNGNNFTVKGDSVINTKDGTTAIKVDGNNNAVVLSGNVIVNGKIEATGTGHFLNLNGTSENGMNMLYDISGFKNMNIDNNVTFFENIKVTGTDTVTVEETGILTLRLKKDDKKRTTTPEAIHAFSENKGGVLIKGDSPSEAGTLNFVTNGIGKEIIVRNITLENMEIKTSSIIDSAKIYDEYIHLGAGSDLNGIVNPKEVKRYNQLNKIYRSIYSSADADNNLDTLRDILNLPTYLGKNYDYNNRTSEEQLANLLGYLGSVYTESPYSYSSELSRKSTGMFRDIVTENHFRPDLNKWMIMGGLTHADGGTKDTYYGQNYHGFDGGTADTDVDMKLTGAYALGKYGYSENVSLGVTVGGNKSEAELSMSKVEGSSGYIGAFVENYRGNLTLKAGGGIQYSEYDADRRTLGGHSYNEKYSDMAYDIYLNGRYSNPVGDNLFLEPYGTLSYTYIDQDGADEGDKALAIETDSKSFDYTVGKAGIDLKKVIPHEKGKSTLSAGVSYTKILDGADEEFITGRFKGGSDFDILVAHKNEHSIGLNAKYALELENGVLFDVKGTYAVERDSHNGTGKNKTKGEWIIGAGLGYKF